MKIVGFMGAHSSAKTTTINRMAQVFRDLKIPVVIVTEVPRDCPIDFNEDGGFTSQMWMLQEQARREKEAISEMKSIEENLLKRAPIGSYHEAQHHYPFGFTGVILCDRTIWDYYAYGCSLHEMGNMSNVQLNILKNAVKNWATVTTYDHLYFCEPKPLYADGVRSIDPEWRENVYQWFKRMIKAEGLEVTIVQ